MKLPLAGSPFGSRGAEAKAPVNPCPSVFIRGLTALSRLKDEIRRKHSFFHPASLPVQAKGRRNRAGCAVPVTPVGALVGLAAPPGERGAVRPVS